MLQFVSGVCLGPRTGYQGSLSTLLILRRTSGGNQFCSVVKKEEWGSWREALWQESACPVIRLLRREPNRSIHAQLGCDEQHHNKQATLDTAVLGGNSSETQQMPQQVMLARMKHC